MVSTFGVYLFEFLLDKIHFGLDQDAKAQLYSQFELLRQAYPEADPWGLDLNRAQKNIEMILPLYLKYFKVRVFGLENILDKPYIVVSNHTGQIAIDGMLICTAFAYESQPPRVLRPMVERFFTALPFVASWSAEGGSVLGDRQNCIQLLKKNQSVLVFPEGVKGIAKSTNEFYQTQNFTRGFYRIALETSTPILPISVIGAEEFFPLVYQAKGIAKKLKLPALPISANYFPLPSPVDIYIGKEIMPEKSISADLPDSQIDSYVEDIKNKIQEQVDFGLNNRRSFFANIKGKK